MDLPENYKLRANFELRFSDTSWDKTHQIIADIIDAIEVIENIETFIPAENRFSLSNEGLLIHLCPGLQAGLVNISGFSSSFERDILVSEAISIQSLLVGLLANKKGILVDCLSMDKKSFGQVYAQDCCFEIKDLYQFHAVELPNSCFLHTHGLTKFACPDLEWYLPLDVDPYRAAQIVDQFIDDMIYSDMEFENGEFIRTRDPNLRLSIKNCMISDKLHYAGNEVMQITVEPGTDAYPFLGTSHDLRREEYFYGYST